MRKRALTAVTLTGLFVATALSGCSSRDTAEPDDWLTVKTKQTAGILMHDVTYRSGALRIRAQVCRPEGGGRHPVLISNHGGFSGLDDWANPAGACASAAKSGWVLAESSYRGEDGSDGEVEVCAGEVDDVQALIDVVRGQPYVDRDRVAMVGVSHGGCVTARALARDAPVDAAVVIAGPTDWIDSMAYLRSVVDDPSTTSADRSTYVDLINVIEEGVGGSPEAVPEQYRERSPVHDLGALQHWPNPLLIIHGGADTVVPMAQACELVRRLGGFRSHRIGPSGSVVAQAPDGCDGIGWSSGPDPAPAFDGDRHFLVYDGVDHIFQGRNGSRVLGDALAFIAAKLTP